MGSTTSSRKVRPTLTLHISLSSVLATTENPQRTRRSLREYLVGEIDHAGETFIFCLGHWFRAEHDYVQKIRDEVAAIADITANLELLPIRKPRIGMHLQRAVVRREGMATDGQEEFPSRATPTTRSKFATCLRITGIYCASRRWRSRRPLVTYLRKAASRQLFCAESEDYRAWRLIKLLLHSGSVIRRLRRTI